MDHQMSVPPKEKVTKESAESAESYVTPPIIEIGRVQRMKKRVLRPHLSLYSHWEEAEYKKKKGLSVTPLLTSNKDNEIAIQKWQEINTRKDPIIGFDGLKYDKKFIHKILRLSSWLDSFILHIYWNETFKNFKEEDRESHAFPNDSLIKLYVDGEAPFVGIAWRHVNHLYISYNIKDEH